VEEIGVFINTQAAATACAPVMPILPRVDVSSYAARDSGIARKSISGCDDAGCVCAHGGMRIYLRLYFRVVSAALQTPLFPYFPPKKQIIKSDRRNIFVIKALTLRKKILYLYTNLNINNHA